MGFVTERITYNVHERGRKHRGVDRHFDTVALAKLINGAAVQERVKAGDLQGYYGHWPRIKFGMAVTEGGIIDGKVVTDLPIAIKTVELSADDQGNITHRAEFLDTAAGRLAASLYDSKTGGFSSAIDVVPGTRPAIPTEFQGFDYVLEPNYNTNRGHRVLLDAVAPEAAEGARAEMLELLDAVAADASASGTYLLTMLDSLQAQHRLALETLERVSRENDLLVGRLASKGASSVLDDVLGEGGRTLPPLTGRTPDFERFRSMPLVALQELPGEEGKPSPEIEAMERRWGVKV